MEVIIGAEARVEIHRDKVIKSRIPKRYRIPELDSQIRKERMRREARLMVEARRAGIPTPIIKDIQGDRMIMERIPGRRLDGILNPELSYEMGILVGKLHNAGIIHGDLTPANMILHRDRIYVIDFGLGFLERSVEARATDLHVLFQMLRGCYPNHQELISEFIKGYSKMVPEHEKILERVSQIDLRARYVERRIQS